MSLWDALRLVVDLVGAWTLIAVLAAVLLFGPAHLRRRRAQRRRVRQRRDLRIVGDHARFVTPMDRGWMR